MNRFAIVAFCLLSFAAGAFGADELKFGSAQRHNPLFYLPPLAAQDGGFWKKNGLEAEYVPFDSGRAMYMAVTAGSVNAGIASVTSFIQSVAAGVPVVAVLDTGAKENWAVWVSGGRPIKKPEDLKGAKIALVGFGGAQHAYGRIPFAALGLEKEVKFVAVGGGIRGQMAVLRTGVVDGLVSTLASMAGLKITGQAKEGVVIDDHLPKKWVFEIILARRDLIKDTPAMAKRMARAMVEALNFIRDNRTWATNKLKAEGGYSEEAAQLIYRSSPFSQDGRLEREALHNVVNFMVENGIVAKEKVPALDAIYAPGLAG